MTGGRWSALLGVLLLAGCSRLVPPPSADATTAIAPLEAWSRVLSRHVSETGEVDLHGLAKDPHDLRRMVRWVYRVSPQTHPALFPSRNHVLAYHLNAYNALLLYLLLPDADRLELDPDLLSLSTVQVGGHELTLEAYRAQILGMRDARLVFPLHALTRGGAGLPRKPFSAETLDADLDAVVGAFLNSLRNVQVDRVGRKIWVSALLGEHQDLFLAQAPTLIEWVNRYRRARLPADYAVDFLAFDRTLNRVAAWN